MGNELKFLIVEDDEAVRFLRRRDIEKGFPGAQIVECDSAETALELSGESAFDGIITDFKLPGANGIEFIAALRARGVGCPMLLVTGNDDPSVRALALAAGASQIISGSRPAFVQPLMALLGTQIPSTPPTPTASRS